MHKPTPAKTPDSRHPFGGPSLRPFLPEADEERASIEEIKKLVSLADAAFAHTPRVDEKEAA